MVPVGCLLGWLVAEGEAPPAADDTAEVRTSPLPKAAANNVGTTGPLGPAVSDETTTGPSPTPASPRARRSAREHGVDLAGVTPTGRSGRIRERDVLAAAAMPAAPAGMRRVPMPPLRSVIASRLERGRQGAIPVTLIRRCDATALRELRQRMKAQAGEGAIVPTLNDLLLKLAAEALHRHPMLAAIWADDHLLLPESLNVGLAVDTESGLRVPVIRDVLRSDVHEVAVASRRLIQAARSGRLGPADMQGGCFTVTNLGSLGIETFTPVLNPPESAILGVGSMTRQPVVLGDGSFAARDVLPLSLTFDHRVNDGAAAARFLATLARLIESPSILASGTPSA